MKKLILTIGILTVLFGCRKDKTPAPAIIPDPEKATLISPAQNEACLTGTVVSATENSVTFKWSNAVNADSYQVTLKNLEDNVENVHSSSDNELTLILRKNTPYSWSVTSRASRTTAKAKSEIWKFFNAGSGEISYAPFPAELLTPTFGQSVTAVDNKVTLDWEGSDVDEDIASYSVFVGTSKNALLSVAQDITGSVFSATVTANTTYYWKVVTKDATGNTSHSSVSQFRVN
ncbi:hypothetical protein WG906_03350 [Pedobacter sp. P351]|uniref:hypothetical protein n=1 Tax=Pedobacter superstes TaxID=3133441 RepID=UPI0030A1CBEA